MFRRVDKLVPAPVSKQDGLTVAPSELVRVFGPPTSELWDAESLGGFYFVTEDGQPFTLYFRSYDIDEKTITELRSSFWLEREDMRFNIGAVRAADVAGFKAWVTAQLG